MTEYFLKASLDYSEDSVRFFHTPSPQAKSMFYYAQEAGHFYCRPDYYTERHDLYSYLAVYTVSGKGFLKYREQPYTLLPGQLFFIDCMENQYYRTDPDELWELLWVHFNGESSHRYFQAFMQNGSPIRTLAADSTIPVYIRELVELQRYKNALTELMTSKLIVDLLTQLLLSTHNDTTSEHTNASFVPDYVARITEYLELHFQEKTNLDQLSQMFNVSKYHLAREFKKAIGQTPNDYLLSVRINKAKELLKDSDHPVSWIASQTGFDYVSHFINMFKKLEEVTPLAFRKKWQSRS